jgi:hypothetical protein
MFPDNGPGYSTEYINNSDFIEKNLKNHIAKGIL